MKTPKNIFYLPIFSFFECIHDLAHTYYSTVTLYGTFRSFLFLSGTGYRIGIVPEPCIQAINRKWSSPFGR